MAIVCLPIVGTSAIKTLLMAFAMLGSGETHIVHAIIDFYT